jgi:hypothetical protein
MRLKTSDVVELCSVELMVVVVELHLSCGGFWGRMEKRFYARGSRQRAGVVVRQSLSGVNESGYGPG